MSAAVRTMQAHVQALEELLARYQPGEYGRDNIEQRLAEARAGLANTERTAA